MQIAATLLLIVPKKCIIFKMYCITWIELYSLAKWTSLYSLYLMPTTSMSTAKNIKLHTNFMLHARLSTS